jgi:hypothetical protein
MKWLFLITLYFGYNSYILIGIETKLLKKKNLILFFKKQLKKKKKLEK